METVGAKQCRIHRAVELIGFAIDGSSNPVIGVDACTNLTSPIWVPVQTNTLSSDSLYFSDPQWTNYPRGFYRLRWQ